MDLNKIFSYTPVVEVKFNIHKIVVSMVESVKYQVERLYPNDKKAIELVSDLLYHLCFQLEKKDKYVTGTRIKSSDLSEEQIS